jgi:poly(3-hydroxybutyrate) depolymerase
MDIRGGLLCAAVTAIGLAGCGSDSQTSTVAVTMARGTLIQNPPFRIATLTAADFKSRLAATSTGQQLLQLTGDPACGVDFYYLEFWTADPQTNPTESSGALMVPTGGTGCSGARPIVLYAHGTNPNKALNIADITDTSNTEGALIAAMFAAQGYIVVAPNYAGYDISTLGYHPFLNAAQQSGEMMDILAAARSGLPNTLASATSDSGTLFLTGYSEGGFVAMATLRAMEAAKQKVTAAAPMSGPYALEALFDAVFYGNVNIDSTIFSPLVTTSYQHAYGDIYSATTDVYSSTYATGIDTLLPSTTPIGTIIQEGKLPETALFDSTTPVVTIPNNPTLSAELTAALMVPSNPVFAIGFGSPYLINNTYRVSYVLDAAANPDGAVPTPVAGVPLAAVEPTQGLRKAAYVNDLRNGGWAPTVPLLMCGGNQDPTVFFSVDTETMATFWSTLPLPAGLINVLDVDAATPAGPFQPIQEAFKASQIALLQFYESPAGGSLSPAAAEEQVIANYHSNVAPFCTLGARAFFSQL